MSTATVPGVTIIPFDGHYYLISFLLTVAMQLSCFFVAYACQFDKITDFAGALNFILLAIFTLCCGAQYHPRQIVISALIVLSRIELGGFLLLRVLKRGKDARFDTFRQNFFKFLGFWIYQILWVYGCMLSVIFVNTIDNSSVPFGTAWDYVGVILFGIGFGGQFLSDVQKYRFRANKANKGKVCAVGLWGITRHPNYFGEMLMFWGLFAMGVSTFGIPGKGLHGWVTLISPIWTMVILLFVGGMMSAEGPELKRFYSTEEKKTMYEAYRRRTPPLIPCIPVAYESLPLVVKRLFCCEWKMYEYSPAPTEATAALQQGREGDGAPVGEAPRHGDSTVVVQQAETDVSSVA